MAQDNPVLRAAADKAPKAPPETLEEGVSKSLSSSSSTTTKVRTVAPNEEGITTNSVIADITAGIEESKIASAQLQSKLKLQATKETQLGDLELADATNKAVIAKQKDIADMEVDINKNELFNHRGGVNEMVELATKKKAAADNMLKTQKEFEALANYDDLGGFLTWMLKGNAAASRANAAEETFKKIDSIQDNFAEFASQTTRALSDMKVTSTHATMAANQKSIANLANQKALAFGIEADKLNALAIEEGRNMSKEASAAQVTKWQMLKQDETFRVAQADKDAIAKRAEKDSRVMDAIIDAALQGEDKIGISRYKGTDPAAILKDRTNMEAKFSLGGAARKEVEALADKGWGVVQPTPYESLHALSLADSDRILKGKNPMLNLLSNSVNSVIQDSNGEAGNINKPAFKLTEENTPNLVNSKFIEDAKEAEATIREGDTTNPNQSPPLSALVLMNGVKEQPLVINVLAPLLTGETKDYTVKQTIDLAFGAVKTKDNPKGTVTFEEAISGLAAIYTKASIENTNTQDRVNLNLHPQTTYNALLKDVEFLFGRPVTDAAFTKEGRIINMMDESALRVLGVKVLARGSKVKLDLLGIPNAGKTVDVPGGILDFLSTQRGK